MINDSNTRNAQQAMANAIAAAMDTAQFRTAQMTSVLHFPDVTEDHVSPKMAEVVGDRASVPLIVSNLQEVQFNSTQETQMENPQPKSPAEQLAETILNNVGTEEATTMIEASDIFSEAEIVAMIQADPIIVPEVTFEATGDFELDQALEQEAAYLTEQNVKKAKQAAKEAEELAKNPPKEPEEPAVKSELRLKAEELIELAGITFKRSYIRARAYVGYPVKPVTPPEEHLAKIKMCFEEANQQLDMAVLAAGKLFKRA